MKTYLRVLLFFVLPLIAPLLYPQILLPPIAQVLALMVKLPELSPQVYPLEMLLGALPAVGVAIVVFVLIGIFLWQGRSLALTFAIFLQGFNVIIRLMMLISTAVTRSSGGQFHVDVPYIVLSLLSIGISLWVLLRLDRVDVHAQMTA